LELARVEESSDLIAARFGNRSVFRTGLRDRERVDNLSDANDVARFSGGPKSTTIP